MSFIGNKNALFVSLGILFTYSFVNILPVSAQYRLNCESASVTSQAGYGTCVGLEYKRADKELNAVWKQVISQMSGDEKERLIDQQLAWIDERDATCDKETRSIRENGGNGYHIFLNLCLRRLTIDRTEILRGYLR